MKYTLSILLFAFCLIGSMSAYSADKNNIFGQSNRTATQSRWSPVSSDASITSSRQGTYVDFRRQGNGNRVSVAPVTNRTFTTDRGAGGASFSRGSSVAPQTNYKRVSDLNRHFTENAVRHASDNLDFASNDFTGDGEEEDNGPAGPQYIGKASNEANPGSPYPEGPVGDAILPLTLMILAFGVWKWRKMH